MKKLVLTGILCFSLALGGLAMDLSVKVTGGMNLLFGGDYNAGIEGENGVYATIPGVVFNSEFSKLSTGLDFGAEAILHFGDNLGLGLGTGYISASNDSTLAVHYGTIGFSTQRQPSISVIPVVLSLHYFMPLGSSLKLHFFGGPGLYFASVKLDSQSSLTIGAVEAIGATLAFTPDGKVAFGLQGGVGLELGLGSKIALVLDVGGRYLSLSNIHGRAVIDGHEGPISAHYETTATLYYHEVSASGNTYGQLTVDDVMPMGGNPRAATISLSGLRFQTGIRIGL
jgi:hypothetical protein